MCVPLFWGLVFVFLFLLLFVFLPYIYNYENDTWFEISEPPSYVDFTGGTKYYHDINSKKNPKGYKKK